MLRKLIAARACRLLRSSASRCSGSSPFRRPFRRARSGALHAESRERQDDVLRRRLRLLPREPGAGRQDPARRRARPEVAVRHFLRAEYLARSEATASASGARRISSPRCGRARRPTASTTYPAFPYTSYQKHAASTTCATCSRYLKTLPAVPGKVRDHDLPVPFQCAAHARRLEIPVPRRRAVHARPVRPAHWNRGAYLVNGPGHCAECH